MEDIRIFGRRDMSLKPNEMNVLVVDDHMLMRKLVCQHLKTLGFEQVETAVNGEEALRLIEDRMQTGSAHNIVFLDWSMPVMDGISLLHRCREDSRFDKIAFVMLTGECEQSNVLKALQAGATSYIVKPVSQDTLSQKIKNVMEWIQTTHKVAVH